MSDFILSLEEASYLAMETGLIPYGTKFYLTPQELSECSKEDINNTQTEVALANGQTARSVSSYFIIPLPTVPLLTNALVKNKAVVNTKLLWESKCTSRHSGCRYNTYGIFTFAHFVQTDGKKVIIGEFDSKKNIGKMFNA